MSDYGYPTLVTIQPHSMESVGRQMRTAGGAAGALSSAASTVYPTTNLALFVPFSIEVPITVAKMFSYNGATASGNIDVGIYDEKGTKIVSSGSTAQAGTSVIQEFDVTDTILGAGLFYLAVAMDNTTGTLFANVLTTAYTWSVLGMAQMATAFALPATATLVTCAQGYLPIIGLKVKSGA